MRTHDPDPREDHSRHARIADGGPFGVLIPECPDCNRPEHLRALTAAHSARRSHAAAREAKRWHPSPAR